MAGEGPTFTGDKLVKIEGVMNDGKKITIGILFQFTATNSEFLVDTEEGTLVINMKGSTSSTFDNQVKENINPKVYHWTYKDNNNQDVTITSTFVEGVKTVGEGESPDTARYEFDEVGYVV